MKTGYNVATFTLNPAYDLVGQCDRINTGTINFINNKGLYPAGKGVNVAHVLHDLGVEVSVSGFLGQENSQEFDNLFNKLKFHDHFYRLEGQTRINIKITEANSHVTDLNFSGCHINKIQWKQFFEKSISISKQMDIVSVNGSLPPSISPQDFHDWLLSLKQACPRLVLDTSREALNTGLMTAPWLIKPNLQELEIWSGYPLSHQQQIIKIGKELLEKGIYHIIVSQGKSGALWVSHKGIWFATPPDCQVVSTVGAGDSMVAGAIYGLLMGKSIPESLRLATATAVLAVEQSNVGIPDKNRLTDILSQVTITTL